MHQKSLPTDLKATERTLKRMDVTDPEPQVPESEDYYQRLHDKIMAQVETKEIKPSPPPVEKTRHLLQRHWRNGLYLVTMSALAAVIGLQNVKNVNSQMSQNHAVLKFQNEDQLIGLLKKSPELMDDTIMSTNASRNIMNEELYTNIDLTKELIESL